MEEINALFHGFSVALTPFNLLLMFIGVTLGVLIGVLPGLGGANGIAILLPLTFTMPPTSAVIMLSCIYWGALFGGAITSILFNIPGEPWSVATTFDGYPMSALINFKNCSLNTFIFASDDKNGVSTLNGCHFL